METREVTVGDRQVEIEAFSTRRTTHTFKAVAALFKRYGALQGDMAEFRRKYGEENPRRITREMCDERASFHRSVGADTEDEQVKSAHERAADSWERMRNGALADQPHVDIPGEPSTEEVIVDVLPKAIENAEEEVARLLGLIVMSNEQFGEARKAARSEGVSLAQVLLDKGDELLDGSDPDQVLELLQAGAELFVGDMDARRERVGKLRKVFEAAFPSRSKTDDQDSGSTTSSETNSESSTDSGGRTAGERTESLTGSPSAELSTSPT